MISTQQIQYILQLHETKNFSKAADQCFVTQPTLSMQIKKAENILGFPVFDRDKNPLELTSLGRQLIPILEEVNQANHQINHLSKKASGQFIEELNIGVIPTISAYLIPLLYKKWKKLLPSTRLVIKESKTEELLDQLEHKKIDFAIMAGPLSTITWKIHELYIEELLAYTQKSNKGELSPEDLQDKKPWLLSQGNCLRSQMMQFCSVEKNVSNDWSFEGGNIELLVKMVELNGGYTLIPMHYKKSLLHTKGSFHSIKERSSNISPARSIIGVQRIRNNKTDSIEKIIHSIQYELNTNPKKDYSIIHWK